ncbi:50S ribosomal protein L3 [Candidatus Vidania fulgoroideorum]
MIIIKNTKVKKKKSMKLKKKRTTNIYISGEHKIVTELNSKEEIKMKINVGKTITTITKSKGKGFAGTIKRHGFSGGNKTHGNSKAHRKPGSIGMCQDPGRVFKGKKMSGHLGRKKNTKKNLLIYISKKKIIFLGNLPGSNNENVEIKNDKI